LFRNSARACVCNTVLQVRHAVQERNIKEKRKELNARYKEGRGVLERASRRAALRGQKHFLERYAPAYRVGIEAAHKQPGKSFEEIEDEIVLNYEHTKPEDPLP
jgi:hypothetical protein